MNGITKDNENIGRKDRIRGIRESLRLTQEAMAELLDLSVDAYGKIENGVNGVSPKVLRKYRDKLGVSADYILFGDYTTRDHAWDIIMNCTDNDKMYFLCQLMYYFTASKKRIHPLKKNNNELIEGFLDILEKNNE